MLRVSISQILHDEAGDSTELLAQFGVDEAGIHPEDGDRIDVVASIPVIDPDTGSRLTSDDNPVRWAELLPQTIRSGDLVALVETVEVGAKAQYERDRIAVLAGKAVESVPSSVEMAH